MKPSRNTSRQRERLATIASGAPRTRHFRRLVVAGSVVALVSLGSLELVAPTLAHADVPAAASERSPEEIERQAEAIARSIMSPFCPGRTVSACPVAGPWRDDIRRWTAEGVDAIEIKRRLAERVPEHNLAGVPKNRLGWILPVGLSVLALGILVFLLRYLVGPRAGAAAKNTSERTAASGDDAAAAERAKPGSATSGSATSGSTAASSGAAKGSDDYDARLAEELETIEQ